MRPPRHHSAFRHEALLYDHDADLLSAVGSFVGEAVEAGEEVLLVFGGRPAELLEAAFPATADVRLLRQEVVARRPAGFIRHIDEAFSVPGGRRRRLRVVGEVFDPRRPRLWAPWARYEVAINELFASYDLWGLCAYDVRHTPDAVLEDVLAAHPVTIGARGGRTTATPPSPEEFLSGPSWPPPDPLLDTVPLLRSAEPTPARARAQVARLADAAALGDDERAALVLGVSEAVANAHLYGRPPVELTAWQDETRLVVSVSDGGSGPSDPLAGLRRGEGDVGGLGLWLAHQVCSSVLHRHGADGFSVLLTGRRAMRPR